MLIELGLTDQKTPAAIDLQELLATRLLVQGNSGSGKSHLLRRLLEKSAPFVQQAIIDPEGDFVSLSGVFGHVVIDASEHSEAGMRGVGARVRQHRISVVLNLEHLNVEQQMRQAAAFLGGLFDIAREYWFPVLVVVDEAQMFAPASAGDVNDDTRKNSLDAMTNLMCRGRKRGLAGVIATQRLAKLAKNVAAEASNFLMGRTFLDIDMARAADLLGIERRQAEVFRDLDRGFFYGLGPAISRRPLRMRIGDVQTNSQTSGTSLMPLPEINTGEAKDLLFSSAGGPPPPGAKAVGGRRTEDLLVELAAARAIVADPPPETAALLTDPAPLQIQPPPLEETETNTAEPPGSGIDKVLDALFGDESQLCRQASGLYETFLERCRLAKVNGRFLDFAHFKHRLIHARAGIVSTTFKRPEWEQVAAQIGTGMTDEATAVFIMLAQAALLGEECPDDSQIARACGSASERRGRAVLAHMESKGIIVISEDVMGRRSIELPDLGWKTAVGTNSVAAVGSWR